MAVWMEHFALVTRICVWVGMVVIPLWDSEMTKRHFILKALVGSRGYGVYDDNSDFDYRGVYVVPTEEILSLGHKYKGTHWIEDKEGGLDDTAYEIGHFLHLATKCNPTILNTLKAPVVKQDRWGKELCKLFPKLLGAKQCYNAFIGYGLNQRKKMLDNKDDRWEKYAAAYIRQLWYLRDLFDLGDYDFVIKDPRRIKALREIKNGEWSVGEIINQCMVLKAVIDLKIDTCGWHELLVPEEPSLEAVNKFLLKVRKEFWKE